MSPVLKGSSLQIQGSKVLVVNGNPADLTGISDYLEGHGLNVLYAQDGEAGIESARHEQPDLILLNATMPGIDGMETCRRLKANRACQEIPLILLLASATAGNLSEGFRLGAADYLTKPFQQDEVLARITTHLHLRQLTRALRELEQTQGSPLAERRPAFDGANRKLRAELAELRRADRARKESEEVHRITLENILDPVFITDSDGTFTFICTNVVHILGYSVDEIQAMGTISELVGDDLFSLEELDALGEIHNIETVIVDKQGHVRTFLITVKRVSIERGTVLYACRDVTERRQAQRELAESRSSLHAILSSMRDLVFAFDRQGKFAHCYAPQEELYLPMDAFIGKEHRQVMPADIDELFSQAFEHCRRGETAEYEYQLDVHGETRWFSVKLSPLLLNDEFAGAVAAARDTTQRRQAEEALRRSLQETSRGQRLLLALGRAAQAVQRAHTSHQVYGTVSEQIAGLGYHAVILTRTDADHLVPSYWTLEPSRLGQIQESVRLPLPDAQLAQSRDSLCDLLHPLAEQLTSLTGPGRAICAPMNAGGELQGLLLVFGSDLREADTMAVTAFANQAAIALENARLLEVTSKHREDLQRLSNLLLDAQEAERKRISLELHDELGQALTVIGMNLEELGTAVPDEAAPQFQERLAETTVLADETLEQVREMALGLRPSLLDDLGLVPALRWHINRLDQRLAIDISFEAVGCEHRLPTQVETALYRIVQEALTNIAKHAQASRACVHLKCGRLSIVTTIEDDGQGFDPSAADAGSGVGLLGMRERAALLGGKLTIDSRPGLGTRLMLEIPRRVST